MSRICLGFNKIAYILVNEVIDDVAIFWLMNYTRLDKRAEVGGISWEGNRCRRGIQSCYSRTRFNYNLFRNLRTIFRISDRFHPFLRNRQSTNRGIS